MNRAAPFIALAALLGMIVLFARLNELEGQIRSLKGGTPSSPAHIAPIQGGAPDVEVAHYMNRIQNYAQKLWLSGQAGNVKLAEFYRHEIKEEMEDVAVAGVKKDGVDISGNMQVYGLRAIDAMKEQLATDGLKDFSAHYEVLIATCNSCHAASGHPELHMSTPASSRFGDQDFTKQP